MKRIIDSNSKDKKVFEYTDFCPLVKMHVVLKLYFYGTKIAKTDLTKTYHFSGCSCSRSHILQNRCVIDCKLIAKYKNLK